MIRPNIDRNKIIYELWEKNLTVAQIASRTGIPRGTVGYYVRKFNRLAAEGKPIVFPTSSKVTPESRDAIQSPSKQILKDMVMIKTRVNIASLLGQQEYEKLYFLLMDLKLINELNSILTPETFKKLFKIT